jgi:hypothetical protein
MERRQRRHDAVLQQKRGAAHHQRALRALPGLPQAVVSRLQLRQQRGAGLGVLRTVCGELQAAAATLEQRGPEFGFEGADQLCHRLQRHTLLACRGRQAATLCGGEKVLNGLELVHGAQSVA